MVTIKRPPQMPRSAGCNIVIIALIVQLVAIVFFFSSSAKQDPSQGPAAQGIKDRLGQSAQALSTPNRSPPLVDVEEGDENEEFLKAVPDLKGFVEEDEIEHALSKLTDEHNRLDGTHSTVNFYFADFVYERENPPFRHATVADWTESHDRIVEQLGHQEIRSCYYKNDDHSILFRHECLKEGTKLIGYNSAHFQRTWCGIDIAPGMAMELDKYCDQPVRLFPKENPPIDGQGMPTIEVTSKPNPTSAIALKEVTCDIPCKYEQNIQGDDRYVSGVGWKIIQTMTELNKEERTAFRQDIYYSTQSFKSSVPLSFFSFDKYNIFSPAVDFDQVDASGSYLVDSQCVSRVTKRNRWADAVEKVFPVKNYGSCAHNTDLPAGKSLSNEEDRMELFRKHRFNLAFDTSDGRDHITPSVWEAISSGTLPIILGASNIKDHLPPHSFVAGSGYQKFADLGTFVAAVASNKTEWQSYQTWRANTEYKRQFDLKYNFTRTSPECRMCRWAYAKRYGLGWSHQHQYVHETVIDRTLCLDDTSKSISKPFKESWHKVSSNGEYTNIVKSGDKSTCTETAMTLSIPQEVQLTRVVSSHDNVIDIVLFNFVKEAPGSDIVLRIELPVANREGSFFPIPHVMVPTMRGAVVSSLAIQDTKSKVMVLASWHTDVMSTKDGVVEVLIRKRDEDLHIAEDERRRIRVIMEDISELNDKVTEFFPSSFAKLHVQDFVDPLELFYVET